MTHNNLMEELISIFEWVAHTCHAYSKRQTELPLVIDAFCEQFVDLKARYSEEEIVQTASKLAGRDAWELHLLARTGFNSVVPLLLERLEQDNDIQPLWAAMGLVYLNNPVGLEALEKMIQQAIDNESCLVGEIKHLSFTLEDIYSVLEDSNLNAILSLREKVRIFILAGMD